MARKTGWRNRIVGEGVKRASEFVANPMNWRRHPQRQREALERVLDSVGWVQRVIVNRQTGHLVDGHERVRQALENGDAEVPYIEVDLTPDEEQAILAVLDPITEMATENSTAYNALIESLAAVNAELGELAQMIAEGEWDFDSERGYTWRIQPPVYEPRGPKPTVRELYDDTRTRAIIAEIQRAEGLSDEVREFLIEAAHRFTVFRFDKIAEFYAQSEPAVQRLMEDQALVIIDYNRAIELGFVRLAERIAQQILEESGEGLTDDDALD